MGWERKRRIRRHQSFGLSNWKFGLLCNEMAREFFLVVGSGMLGFGSSILDTFEMPISLPSGDEGRGK